MILYYRLKKLNSVFNKYYTSSAIILDPILVPHSLLIILLKGNISKTRHFQKKICFYNNISIFILSYYIANEWPRYQDGI